MACDEHAVSILDLKIGNVLDNRIGWPNLAEINFEIFGIALLLEGIRIVRLHWRLISDPLRKHYIFLTVLQNTQRRGRFLVLLFQTRTEIRLLHLVNLLISKYFEIRRFRLREHLQRFSKLVVTVQYVGFALCWTRKRC